MFSINLLPALDGDCILVEVGSIRILIDGGRTDTGRLVLKPFLKGLSPRPGRPTIDLLILSHFDGDHILGLLDLLKEPGAMTVGDVWFNGRDQHLQAGDIQLPRRPVKAETHDDGVLGAYDAQRFEKTLRERGWPWNAATGGGALMVPDDGTALPRISLARDVVLVLLGPPQRRLAKLLDHWPAVEEGAEEDGLALAPRPKPTVDNVESLAAEYSRPDRTAPNGGSIAFVVEAEGKKALFAADALPEDLDAALTRYGGAGRHSFDAVKAPHHGSAHNNLRSLVDRLHSPLWLISTNGAHNHPDGQAIARMVLAPPAKKTIVFNYEGPAAMWAEASLRQRFGYSVTAGGPTSVTL